jgi:anti-sigma-K factor RskA
MTTDEIRELGALYAIGALDPATAKEIETCLHAASADERREIEELREVAAMLPLALPAAPLPPQLKERLLARLHQEPQVSASINTATDSSRVAPFMRPARAESQSARWLLIAAVLTLALLSSLLFWQNSRLTRQLDDLAQQVNLQSEQLTAQQQKLEQFTSPSTRVIAMMGEAAPQARAKVIWDTTRQEWVIYFDNLPGAPADKDYQLWYITSDSSKVGAQVFRPDASGRLELRLSLPPGIAPRLAATAVTLEPKGGSEQPTGQIFLKGVI